MQQIPSNIRTLLKSRSIVGPNAPSAVVRFDDAVGAGGVDKSWGHWNTYIAGLAWCFTDSSIWVCDTTGYITKYNPTTGAEIKRWPLPAAFYPNGCEFDGSDMKYLWLEDGAYTIKFDITNHMTQPNLTEVQRWSLGQVDPTATAWNGLAAPPGDYLFIGTNGAIYKYRKSDMIRVDSLPINMSVSGLAWDGARIWAAGAQALIIGIDPVTGVEQASFNGPSSVYTGLTWDGSFLWGGDDATDKFVRFSTTQKIIAISSLRVSRQSAAMAQGCTMSFPNVGPSNPRDIGYFSPDRGADIPAQATPWQGVLMPGRGFKVSMGYGSDMVQIFQGQVDDVTLNVQPSDHGVDYTVELETRDDGWILLDKTVDDGTGKYVLVYANQAVENITVDLLQRAGFPASRIKSEPTGITVVKKTFEHDTYADAIEWCMKVSGFELIIDERGVASFLYPTDRQPSPPVPEPVVLTGLTGTALNNHPIVTGSEIITNDAGVPYATGLDYSINYATAVVSRVAGTTIPDGGTVKADYVYAAWTFREGEDLFQLPYKITRRNVYGKVVVYGAEKDKTTGVKYRGIFTFPSRAQFGIPDNKVLITDIAELDSDAKCQLAADQMGNDMIRKVREISFAAVCVPWLQVGDCVQVVETSTTISEIYRVTSIEIDFDEEGAIMTCTAYHYGYAPR